MNMIDTFEGEYEFLSNFYEVPINFRGLTYGSSEAAFQAWKSLDPSVRERFTSLSPDQSKREGYKVNLRADWEEVKVSVMDEILPINRQKAPSFSYGDEWLYII